MRPDISADDLSDFADDAGTLRGFDGVRPWNLCILWLSVLAFGARARSPREHERFHQALGALKVLDALCWRRKDDAG